jgi:uncharacterized RDD family membrane protein YckC
MQPENQVPPIVPQVPQAVVASPVIQPVSQQVQTSPVTPTQVVYAGFWRRFCAFLLDSLILGTVSTITKFIIGFVMGAVATASGSVITSQMDLSASLISSLVLLLLQAVYFVGFTGAKGQTFGKMAFKIKVVKIGTNEACGYVKAFLREIVGRLISAFVIGLGYFWMLWDKDKQTWHDKIAGTVVIKV